LHLLTVIFYHYSATKATKNAKKVAKKQKKFVKTVDKSKKIVIIVIVAGLQQNKKKEEQDSEHPREVCKTARGYQDEVQHPASLCGRDKDAPLHAKF
jgi:hypothetical protein